SNLTRYHSKGLADSLRQNLFTELALTPPMPWKSMVAPGAPENLGYRWSESDTTLLEIFWDAPEVTDGAVEAVRYAIYRVYGESAPDVESVTIDASNLIALTGETSITDRPLAETVHYYVTAVSSNSVEAAAETVMTVEGRAVSADRDAPLAFELGQNYPNPFNPSTRIEFTVAQVGYVSLKVYDLLGREIATLREGRMAPGSYTARFDADHLSSGTYVYVLEGDGHRLARPMVLLK
ncbi:MAG: T9SS type A sorting domain-containing protein, partial [Bacteroidota bacterium]